MNILTISVHPDDETLGCGGTLLRHAAAGGNLHWLLMTAAHPEDYSEEQIVQQEQQVTAVQAAYPFESLTWLKLPTSRLEQQPLGHMVREIRKVVERLNPEVVFLPSRSDVHSDHRVVFDASMSTLKAFYMRHFGVQRILACEVLSETETGAPAVAGAFTPNVFVDVSGTLERKIQVFSLYTSEIQADLLPRSPSAIRALARFRGATIGVEYAEAFMLIREVG